ncbi:hypothetical protein [Porphyromonas vaginalis]|uniref:hypothetical protein n=1 Tax=Porphyromonas vaginalis TaxID=3044325 RepID=UPI00263969A4|nr:hypothetical protein [Porphyromonas vaginalis]
MMVRVVYQAHNRLNLPLYRGGELWRRVTFAEDGCRYSTTDGGEVELLDEMLSDGCRLFWRVTERCAEEPSAESAEEPSVESAEEPSVESVEESSVESVEGSEGGKVVKGVSTLKGVRDYLNRECGVVYARMNNRQEVLRLVEEYGLEFPDWKVD